MGLMGLMGLLNLVGVPLVDECLHVVGEFRGEHHLLAGAWVYETECLGVQCLSWADLEAVVDELPVACRCGSFEYLVAAVAFVVEQYMANVLHVCSDLMCASCFQYALHECGVAKSLQWIVVCDCMFAHVAVGWKHGHLHTVLWVASYVALDASFVFCNMSPHQCVVFALGGLVEELPSEVGLGFRSLGNDQQSACVLVDAVYKSYFRVVDVVFWEIFEMPGEGIEQCAVPVAVSWVYDQSGLLVDDNEVVVFINNVDWNFFGDNGIVVVRTVEHHSDDVEWLDLVTAFDGAVVAEDESCIGSTLNAVAAGVGQVFLYELIDSHQFLATVGYKAVVLIQSCRFFVVEFGVVKLVVIECTVASDDTVECVAADFLVACIGSIQDALCLYFGLFHSLCSCSASMFT